MRPEFEKIIDKPQHSFLARKIKRKRRAKLSEAWHYHPEIEICYTTESNGKRFVGNQIADYFINDLVMFGSNLPHGFVTEEYSNQIVIQMNEDFLGESFIKKPELREINNLFKLSKRGLVFGEQTINKVHGLINKILKGDHMIQLIDLLSLLNILAQSKDVTAICSEEYAVDANTSQFSRLRLIYDHVMDNFKDDLSIQEVASKINLSEAGFYKFIKKHTKKSYTQIVNEFRINYACRQLIESEKSIAEIAFDSGFNNQSYFNRKFKAFMGSTPYDFKRRYSGSSGRGGKK